MPGADPEGRKTFHAPLLALMLCVPQLFVTLAFFIWPSMQALWQSVLLDDAFGGNAQFLCADLVSHPLMGEAWSHCFYHYINLLDDPSYWMSVRVTLVFSALVTVICLCGALVLAVLADQSRAAVVYTTLLVWPYAVAPAVAAVIWGFLFNPKVGVFTFQLWRAFGIELNYVLNGTQALWICVAIACWSQFSYNFLFFLAALQGIPKSLIEASAIDGAGPFARFRTIILPLLSPTAFFLLVVNVIFAFFGTFGVINALTRGGPANQTAILVYKVYADGFLGSDFSGSAAQSVILMAIVLVLTIIQFRFVERRVHY